MRNSMNNNLSSSKAATKLNDIINDLKIVNTTEKDKNVPKTVNEPVREVMFEQFDISDDGDSSESIDLDDSGQIIRALRNKLKKRIDHQSTINKRQVLTENSTMDRREIDNHSNSSNPQTTRETQIDERNNLRRFFSPTLTKNSEGASSPTINPQP